MGEVITPTEFDFVTVEDASKDVLESALHTKWRRVYVVGVDADDDFRLMASHSIEHLAVADLNRALHRLSDGQEYGSSLADLADPDDPPAA